MRHKGRGRQRAAELSPAARLRGDPPVPALWHRGTVDKGSDGAAGDNPELEARAFGAVCAHAVRPAGMRLCHVRDGLVPCGGEK